MFQTPVLTESETCTKSEKCTPKLFSSSMRLGFQRSGSLKVIAIHYQNYIKMNSEFGLLHFKYNEVKKCREVLYLCPYQAEMIMFIRTFFL